MTHLLRVGHFLVLFLLSVLSQIALAASLTLESTTNKVTEGEVFELRLRFDGISSDGFADLSLPAGLKVVGRSESSMFQMINGKSTATKTLSFSVLADAKGTHQIGPFSVVDDGKTYESNSMTLTVAEVPVSEQGGTGAEQGGEAGNPPFAVSARLTEQKAYVGQWVYLVVEMSTQASGRELSFRVPQVPEVPGLTLERITDAQRSARVENGIRINTERYIFRLTPQSAGVRRLEGIRQTAVASEVVRGRGGGIFGSMMGNVRRRDVSLAAPAVELEVLPLPVEGRPADFSGIVGDTSWSVSLPQLQSGELKTGDSATLTVTLESAGNLAGVELAPPEVSGNIKLYPNEAEMQLISRDGKILHQKVWTFALVPTEPGEGKIAPLQLGYFSASQGKFETLNHEFPSFQVTGTAQTPDLRGSSQAVEGTNAAPLPLERKGIDIFPIRTKADDFQESEGRWLVILGGFTALMGLVFFLLQRFAGFVQSWREQSGRWRRRQSALTLACARLAQTSAGATAAQEFLNATKEYFGTRLGQPLMQKTAMEVAAELQQRMGKSENVPEDFVDLLRQLEMKVYSPSDSVADPQALDTTRSQLKGHLEWFDKKI